MEPSHELAVRARCHCGKADFSYTFPNSGFILPLKSAICHCEDCRYSTGSTFATFAVIPAERPDFSSLRAYHSSDNLTRYFCDTCGATVGNTEPTEWELAPGLFDKVGSKLLNRVQMFVGSTRDGGASIWLPQQLYGRRLQRCSKDRTSEQINDGQLAEIAGRSKPSDPNKLHARCHCGSVQFYVKRPEIYAQDSKHVGRKYKAAPCPCESCRLTSGQEFMAWTYVPPLNVRSPNSTPFNIYHPSLVHYSSSPGFDRTFCRTCGAKLFYRNLNDGPNASGLWDIAVGLFRGESVRLEDWLYWDPEELAFLEESTDREVCKALSEGIRARHAEIASEEELNWKNPEPPAQAEHPIAIFQRMFKDTGGNMFGKGG